MVPQYSEALRQGLHWIIVALPFASLFDFGDDEVLALLHELKLDLLVGRELVEQRFVFDREAHGHCRPFHALDRIVRDRDLAACRIGLLYGTRALMSSALRAFF